MVAITIGSPASSAADSSSATVAPDSTTSATALTRSSSRMFITFTPCVARPICEIPPALVRWTIPFSRDEQQVLVLADDQRAGEAALLRGQLRRQDALGATPLDRVLGDRVRLP